LICFNIVSNYVLCCFYFSTLLTVLIQSPLRWWSLYEYQICTLIASVWYLKNKQSCWNNISEILFSYSKLTIFLSYNVTIICNYNDVALFVVTSPLMSYNIMYISTDNSLNYEINASLETTITIFSFFKMIDVFKQNLCLNRFKLFGKFWCNSPVGLVSTS